MHILFIDWNSFGNEDMIFCLKKAGHKIDLFPIPENASTRYNPPLADALYQKLLSFSYDFVFSFNYFPAVSNTCEKIHTPYLSWVYDSPFVQLYSDSLGNRCNHVFIFDHEQYAALAASGFRTVHYLPMAANTSRYDSLILSAHKQEKYKSEISFVGSLYSEPKNQLYEKLNGVTEFTKGYLDGIIDVQKKIYGSFMLEDLLTGDILADMQKSYPIVPNEDGFETAQWVYANYFLARKVTSLERTDILKLLSEKHQVNLYTKEPTPFLPKVKNCGYTDYYMQMPYVFKCSKINLNISLRSIHSGIPLRIFDIMGCGGFVLTNYQEDLLQFFEPDVDFVYYEDYEDLLQKADYYLSHDQEREQIAKNGYEKVKQAHTFEQRIAFMLNALSNS